MPFWQFFRKGWDGHALLVRPSKMHHIIWKILFVLCADEYLERLEGKIRKCLFFYVKIFKDNSVIWTKAIRYFIRFDLSYKLNVTASLGLVLLFQLCINSIFYLCLDLVYLPLNFNSINLFKNITAWKGVKYILTIISIGRRKVWNLWGASVIRGA